MSNIEEAKKHFDEGVRVYKTGDNDKEIEDYNKAIELDLNFVETYNNLGVTYAEKGDYKEAFENFRKYVEFANKNLNKVLGIYFLLLRL